MEAFGLMIAWTVGVLLAGTLVLHTLPWFGKGGKALSALCCKAPGLDLVITYFTVLPWLVGAIILGWSGFIAGIIGQVIALTLWSWAHELVHLKAKKGPRIVKVLNALVGRWRNHGALWVTALAVPVFWFVRLGEWVVYPPLVLLVKFPRYKQGEWINLSRQKFDGLVGHDLVWCLYCDWMTGVWSLGTEMLRNVESFWCPIRFSDAKKCENCQIDFPDVFNAWVPADGSMADVTALLEKKYGVGKPTEEQPASNSWFGHPERGTVVELTVEGRQAEEEGGA